MSFRTVIGIRGEDKNPWERRAPLSPTDVRLLLKQDGLEIIVESSLQRAFDAEAYAEAGAPTVGDLNRCTAILGVKEIPAAKLIDGMTYLFFAHVIKGQPANMPLLRALLDQGCSLIDYEKITNERGERLIFFGRHAGLAGMIDTLWALGQRWARRGVTTPFAGIRRAYQYAGIDDAKHHFEQLGRRLAREGIPAELQPLTIGLTGYGNVSRGAQELLDLLPICTVEPEALVADSFDQVALDRQIIKVVFEERHLFEPIEGGHAFELQEYYDHPERYRGCFERSWPALRVLVNCIYWDTPYPRLITRSELRERANNGPLRLDVVGDISCDIDGAIEMTRRATTVAAPVFTYEPASDSIRDGFRGSGPVVMAIDNLPCELPADATRAFGDGLTAFIPALAAAHGPQGLNPARLPAELRRALIVDRGTLTPDFEYLAPFVA